MNARRCSMSFLLTVFRFFLVSRGGPPRRFILPRLHLGAPMSTRCRRQEKLRSKGGAPWCRMCAPPECERRKNERLSRDAGFETRKNAGAKGRSFCLFGQTGEGKTPFSSPPLPFSALSLFPMLLFTLQSNQSTGRGPAPDVQRARRVPGHHRLCVRDGVAARAVLRPGKIISDVVSFERCRGAS